jgi:hypothetical protein
VASDVTAIVHPADAATAAAVGTPAISAADWRGSVIAAAPTGASWLWLVAGGVVPAPGALDALLAAVSTTGVPAPALLASRVVDASGRLEPACAPWIPLHDRAVVMDAAERGLAAIRLARWGSLLVSRAAVERHGPPRAGFAEADLEWTGRILRDAHGYLVPGSVATGRPHGLAGTARRLRDRARMLRGDGWLPQERLWFAYMTARELSPSRSPRATVARLR